MTRIMLFLTLFAIIATCALAASERIEVVTLKNHDVIKGTIIEFVPDDHIVVQQSDGGHITIKYYNIAKITVEAADTSAVKSYPLLSDVIPLKKLEPYFSKKVGFGMKVGLAVSGFYGGTQHAHQLVVPSYCVGLMMTDHISNAIAFQIELLYLTKGSNLYYPVNNMIYKTETVVNSSNRMYGDRIAYLELPFLYKFYLSPQGHTSPYLELGALFAKVVKSNKLYDSYYNEPHNLSDMDFDLLTGFGWEGRSSMFSLRYEFGVTPLYSSDVGYKNSTFTMQLGVKWR